MADQDIVYTADDVQLIPITTVSAQEIDDVVTQFRLFSRRLSQQQMRTFVSELPKMTEADLAASGCQDDVCPICFTAFLATLAEEEVALAIDSPAHPVDELGVTKLHNTCGHIFCRKDILKWITEGHNSCPACRRPLVTDEGRRDGLSLPLQLGESRLQPWIVDSSMVARQSNVPTQLPTLPIDSFHAFGVENDRHQFAGMYS